jgi:hypothetical protein
MQDITTISSPSALCTPLRETMRADALSVAEENEVYRLQHAVRQVQNSSLKAPAVELPRTNHGFVRNLLIHSLRTISAFYGERMTGRYTEAQYPATSLSIQPRAAPSRPDRVHEASSSGIFSYVSDPLIFPGAAAELAYTARATELTDTDVHFFSAKSHAGGALLAALDDESGNLPAAEMQGLLEDKELLLAFVAHAISKRAAPGAVAASTMEMVPESTDQQQYLDQHCKIRTKTNTGTIVGDSLLVSGEYIRNPVRGVLEKIKAEILPGHPLTDMEVTLAEINNVVQDVIFGIWSLGAYPIIKYAAAKSFTAAGHSVNGDLRCLKNEFSGEEMAQLLFDTEVGLTNRGLMNQRVPAKLSEAKGFKPDGLFVQEHLPTGIHTEKYMAVQRNGQEIRIREKSPGEFVTCHPHAMHGERLEQRVFFDQKKQRIFFERQLPEDSGYDFDIVDGRKYIQLHGKNHELVYNWNARRSEIKIETASKSEVLPVYMEKLSHAWHLSERGGRPVFAAGQVKWIDRIKLKKTPQYVYRATENLNVKTYGHGKIYEARLAGKFISESPALHAVEMHGELVPVRLKVTPGHGIRYETYNTALPEKAGRPVEWDGERWIFESATSRHVANSLKNAINKDKLDQISLDRLSAPDDNGIRWDSKDRGFLKIRNGFVQLHSHRYHPDRFFVRQASRNIQVVLKNHQFHLETLAQRLQKLKTIGLSGRLPGQSRQASIMKKRTAAEIVADVYHTSIQRAKKQLCEYRFPEHGVFDEMEFALHLENYQSVPPWAKRFKLSALEQQDVTNPKIDLGEHISDGAFGVVYEDLASEHFLIKKYKDYYKKNNKKNKLVTANSEADLFSRYYGPGSASVIENGDEVYLRMYKVPGKGIDGITLPKWLTDTYLPEDACERYVDMLERMLDVGIIHKDLHMGNFMYESSNQQFYPIDFSTHSESFFSSSVKMKEKVNAYDERNWKKIIQTIRSLKKESADELVILKQVPFSEAERELIRHGFWLDDIVRIRELGGLTRQENNLLNSGKTVEDIVRLRQRPSPME